MPRERALIWCAVSTVVQANEDEKFSMPQQEADARAVAASLGMTIVDVLRVPGHSRDYLSLDKLAADAQKRGIDAFYKLIDHLENCDFDVFICRDANRFARTASLLHYIVASIMQCDAEIYSLTDGWINRSNANIWAAFKGYETNQQIKWLVEAKAKGYERRIQRGLIISPSPPVFLRTVRDPDTGKEQYVEINEDLRRLYDDIAGLLLAGTPWYDMEEILFQKGGHVNPKTGKPWTTGTVNYFVLNPLWWGHSAMNHHYQEDKRTQTRLPWIWDETVDPPEGVTVYRNTVPAIWTGDLAKDIQQELYRRYSMGKRRGVEMVGKFAGLLVCQECGYALSIIRKKRARGDSYFTGWRCTSFYSRRRQRAGISCNNKYQMADSRVQEYIHNLLVNYAAGENAELFKISETIEAETARAIELAEAELSQLTQGIQSLIRQQALAALSAQSFYQAEIDAHGDRIKAIRERIQALNRQAIAQERANTRQRAAIRTITEDLELFWKRPATYINQYLHAAFGKTRLVVSNKEIVGDTNATRKAF